MIKYNIRHWDKEEKEKEFKNGNIKHKIYAIFDYLLESYNDDIVLPKLERKFKKKYPDFYESFNDAQKSGNMREAMKYIDECLEFIEEFVENRKIIKYKKRNK